MDLVNISVGDLGFKNRTQYDDICPRAVEMGMELCPAEVGPALRLVYDDQPQDEWLRVAMEAITDSGGDRSIFAVGRSFGGLWLSGSHGRPGYFGDAADDRFLFLRRRC